MSGFSSNEVKDILELAFNKEALDHMHTAVSNHLDYQESDLLETAKEMGISETSIRDAIEQLPLYRKLKHYKKTSRVLRAVGLPLLVVAIVMLGLWLFPVRTLAFAVGLPTLFLTWGSVGLLGSLYRGSYIKRVELEMDLSLDDGEQITEEMACFLDTQQWRKQSVRREREGIIESENEIFSGLVYLVSPPTPAIVRYQLKRVRTASYSEE